MPFLRFSRDKRGYEHVYLVHAANRRGKPSRPRILYWYRTPPGVKVGRKPFDDEVQRALEAQYPGVVFDWKTIMSTPAPPPDPEFWRERRRAEKVAKQERRTEPLETDLPEGEAAPPPEIALEAVENQVEEPSRDLPTGASEGNGPTEAPSAVPSQRRRRRRGGRRRHGGPSVASPQPESASELPPVGASESVAASDTPEPSERVEPTSESSDD